jgi:uncharacterized protein (DUF433 family)
MRSRIACVAILLLLVGARATTNLRTGIIATIAMAISVPPAVVVLIARAIPPSSVKHTAPPTDSAALPRPEHAREAALLRCYNGFVVNEKPVVHSDPEIMSGTPVFVGTRVPFQTLIDYLEAGQPLSDFLDDFPTVSREQAIAALEQAKEALLDRARPA